MKTLNATTFSKSLGTRIFEVQKYGLQSNQVDLNQSELITAELKNIEPKTNIILLTIVHYTKWCRGIHMIHKLVQFLQHHEAVHFIRQQLWHIITCNQYIHTLQYLYHVNSLTEQATLHNRWMANHLQQASQLHEIIHHTKTHPIQ